ncbi:MAG: DUF4034 domain-containing protein [Aquabacterium sp.]|uniref:DUF4034 domain-containing protein n=1 Tax=Aquabacterium sp. TaxID=1872578 RepID=UPI00120BD842|nr:DUF4034 domain-containing protein [Aquabacterium sp.]TAK95627.1 MAG: DUF4034 domain-containing protein [Aquabacterium sp.]
MKNMGKYIYAAIVAMILFVPIADATARKYMGPTDMTNWFKGPTCMEIDEADSNNTKKIDCNEADIRVYESQWIVPNAFHNGNFDQLENLYSNWLREDARYAGGTSKTSLLCSTLEDTMGGTEIQFSLAKIQKWQKLYKDSFLSKYAEAAYWRASAWSARGGGYSRTVTREGWALFRDRLMRASSLLDALQEKASEHPAWYTLKIDIMIDAGEPIENIKKVYLKGISIFPKSHAIYFAMARAYTPLYGGTPKSFDKFVSDTVERTKNFEGNSFYARLYWTADDDNNLPFVNESSKYPNWPTLKTAYLDLMQHYPDSIWNKNRFALVACRTDDGPLYRKLRTEIEGQIIDGMFPPGERDKCDLKHKWH